MSSEQRLYCDEPDCERLVAGHGRGKCSGHLKQLQRTGKTSPIAEKLSPEERLLAATNAWVDADGDEEYDSRRRAVLAAAKSLGFKEMRAAIRAGIALARARGIRIGRPRKVSDQVVAELFRRLKSVAKVAEALDVSERTVQRRL